MQQTVATNAGVEDCKIPCVSISLQATGEIVRPAAVCIWRAVGAIADAVAEYNDGTG